MALSTLETPVRSYELFHSKTIACTKGMCEIFGIVAGALAGLYNIDNFMRNQDYESIFEPFYLTKFN